MRLCSFMALILVAGLSGCGEDVRSGSNGTPIIRLPIGLPDAGAGNGDLIDDVVAGSIFPCPKVGDKEPVRMIARHPNPACSSMVCFPMQDWDSVELCRWEDVPRGTEWQHVLIEIKAVAAGTFELAELNYLLSRINDDWYSRWWYFNAWKRYDYSVDLHYSVRRITTISGDSGTTRFRRLYLNSQRIFVEDDCAAQAMPSPPVTAICDLWFWP